MGDRGKRFQVSQVWLSLKAEGMGLKERDLQGGWRLSGETWNSRERVIWGKRKGCPISSVRVEENLGVRDG